MTLMLLVVRLVPPALLRWLVRWRFKTVQQQSPIDAARALNSEPVLVLDVRTRGEFDSEHLARAIHVTDAESALRLIRDFKMSKPNGQVVAYCTVGYRSAQWVERLTSNDCADVKNLEGGIWAWVAAGYPIITAAES